VPAALYAIADENSTFVQLLPTIASAQRLYQFVLENNVQNPVPAADYRLDLVETSKSQGVTRTRAIKCTVAASETRLEVWSHAGISFLVLRVMSHTLFNQRIATMKRLGITHDRLGDNLHITLSRDPGKVDLAKLGQMDFEMAFDRIQAPTSVAHVLRG
jgi:hypothetical protein